MGGQCSSLKRTSRGSSASSTRDGQLGIGGQPCGSRRALLQEGASLQRGDEVIVPSISWATTYYPLQQYGLRLRFVDVDLHTLNIDVTQLARALTPRTRMVVAVSILGNPCALDVLRAFCDATASICWRTTASRWAPR